MFSNTSRLMRLSVLLGFIAMSGCGPGVTDNRRFAHKTSLKKKHSEFALEDQKTIKRNCPFGMPELVPGWLHGPTQHVVRSGYVLEHSCIDKIPLWVSERVKVEQLSGEAVRKNKFKADPQLSESCRSEKKDYKYSGFDRGHQAPAGNQAKDQTLKDETFYLSNMAPQKPTFNQYVWGELEESVRDWIKDGLDDAYVITGGLFYDPKEEDPSTADGMVDYYIIGSGEVAVPTHFYKIVVAQDSDGTWQAVAFVLENRKYAKPYEFATYIRSIDWVEERTGLDFMPQLDPASEKRLERDAGSLVPFGGE